MNEINPELEQAVHERPGSEEPYLVYGDWLQERGHPRGELVAIDRELALDPWGEQGVRLRRRRVELLEGGGAELLGPLAAPEREGELELDWHLGFVRRASLALDRPDEDALLDALDEILAHPSLRFLRALEIGPLRVDGEGAPWAPIVERLAERPWPALQRLSLGLHHDGAWPALPDPAPLLARAPALGELALAGRLDDGVTIAHPGLRSLELHLLGIAPSHLAALEACPGLEQLTACFAESNLDVGTIAGLAAALPDRIRHLGLVAAPFANALCKNLPPELAALETLDLSMGSITDAGAKALARTLTDAHRGRVLVQDNRIGEAGAAALAGLPNVEVGPQDPQDSERAMFPRRARRALSDRPSRGNALWNELRYDEALPLFASMLRIARVAGDARAELRAERALGALCHNLGRIDEAIAHRERWLALSRRLGQSPFEALLDLAQSNRSRGRMHRAGELLELATERAEQDGNENGGAKARAELAGVHMSTGRWRTAASLCQQAVEVFERDETPYPRAWNILGAARQRMGDYAGAEESYRRALEQESHPQNRLPIQMNLGQVQWHGGRLEQAEQTYREVVEAARETHFVHIEGAALGSLGHLYVNSGRMPQAEQALREALPLLRRTQSRAQEGEVLTHLGIVQIQQKKLEEAEASLLQAREVHRDTGNRQWEAIALTNLAGVAIDRGQLDRCAELCREAAEILREVGDRWSEATCHSQLGDVHLVRGEHDEALACFERSRSLSASVGNRRWVVFSELEGGRAQQSRGDWDEAQTIYERSIATLTEIGDPQLLGRAHLAVAALHAARGEREAAARKLAAGRELLEESGDATGLHLAELTEAIAGELARGELREPGPDDEPYAAWLRRALRPAGP